MIDNHRPLGSLAAACAAAATLTLASAAAPALEAGDVLMRFRGIDVVPLGDSDGIAPDLLAASLDPEPAGVPELDLTYMLTDHLGLELIAAVSPHDIEGGGTIVGLGDVAESWLLPPTLTLQYHFNPQSSFRPYVGVGVNYTITFAENADPALEAGLGPTEVDLDNSIGYALQAGIDIDMGNDRFFNVDIKPIIFGVGFGVGFGFRF